MGFDYYHLSKDSTEAEKQKSRQKEWFHAQAQLAKKYHLAVVIHTRNCPDITLSELRMSGLQKFVVHCFSESWDMAEQILNLSPYTKISFTGILTYKKSIAIQDIARRAPLDRIMIETDAPYLVPEPYRGKLSYCEPVHSLQVFEQICRLRPEKQDNIEQQIWENSINFFNLL